jgi:hypothetical protein
VASNVEGRSLGKPKMNEPDAYAALAEFPEPLDQRLADLVEAL